MVYGHNITKQSCLGLWFLKISYSCCGERREFAAQWGRCTPGPACRSTCWLCTGWPYSQKEEQYIFFFSSPFPRGKMEAVPVMYTKIRDIFAMLLSHLQWYFFCLLTTPFNLIVCTSYFHLDLAEYKVLEGRKWKKKRKEKRGMQLEERGEDPFFVPSKGKSATLWDQPLLSTSGFMLQTALMGAKLHSFSCWCNCLYEANHGYFLNRFLLTFHVLMGCAIFNVNHSAENQKLVQKLTLSRKTKIWLD